MGRMDSDTRPVGCPGGSYRVVGSPPQTLSEAIHVNKHIF